MNFSSNDVFQVFTSDPTSPARQIQAGWPDLWNTFSQLGPSSPRKISGSFSAKPRYLSSCWNRQQKSRNERVAQQRRRGQEAARCLVVKATRRPCDLRWFVSLLAPHRGERVCMKTAALASILGFHQPQHRLLLLLWNVGGPTLTLRVTWPTTFSSLSFYGAIVAIVLLLPMTKCHSLAWFYLHVLLQASECSPARINKVLYHYLNVGPVRAAPAVCRATPRK